MAETGRLSVGVAQVHSALGDVQANAKAHIEFIREARKAGVDLLLFPELSLTGYEVGPRTVELALERDHPIIREIAEASGEMCTVFGFIEEGVAAQFHNSAIAVRDGAVAFIHRKLNLATYGQLEEGKHFAAGRYVETFDLRKAWRAGVLICADVWNPALTHLAAVQGSTLLMVPVASTLDAIGGEFSNPRAWQRAVDFYAMIYGMPTVFANHCGIEKHLRFWGGSRILDPHGDVLAEAGDGEELIVAVLDYDAVRRARYQLPTLRDSNLDLVYRELGRQSWMLGIPPESRQL